MRSQAVRRAQAAAWLARGHGLLQVQPHGSALALHGVGQCGVVWGGVGYPLSAASPRQLHPGVG